MSRFVRAAAVGNGCEERRVGLHQHAVERAERRGIAQFRCVLERDDPAEGQVRTAVEAPASFLRTAAEAVDDRVLRDSLGVENVVRVLPRVARVDDEREPVLLRECDLVRECTQLGVTR